MAHSPEREQRSLAKERNRNIAVGIVVSTAATLSLVGLHGAISRTTCRARYRRTPPVLSKDWSFVHANRVFDELEFSRAYRMDRRAFTKLLFLVRPLLQKNKEMGRMTGRPAVCPEVRLGLLLCAMASESIWGCLAQFQVGRATAYQIFRDTKTALHKVLNLPGLSDTFDGLKRTADDFQRPLCPPSMLPGCVGLLHAFQLRSRNHTILSTLPDITAEKVTTRIRCKHCWLLCFSASCCGSNHNSLAQTVSSLERFLESGRLSGEFWIAAYEACVCAKYLITPIQSSQASDEEGAFNLYHSSLHMHVEQSFGLLVKKWILLPFLTSLLTILRK